MSAVCTAPCSDGGHTRLLKTFLGGYREAFAALKADGSTAALVREARALCAGGPDDPTMEEVLERLALYGRI